MVLALVVAAAVAVFTGCEITFPTAGSLPPDSVRVHFLDVGQADCEFIELPNGQTMVLKTTLSAALARWATTLSITLSRRIRTPTISAAWRRYWIVLR